MRNYETMLIVDPDLEIEVIGKAISKFEDLIKKHKGEIEKTDKWGRRKMAYPIEGRSDGYYAIIYFKANTPLIRELDRVLNISDEVLRFIILRRDKAASIA